MRVVCASRASRATQPGSPPSIHPSRSRNRQQYFISAVYTCMCAYVITEKQNSAFQLQPTQARTRAAATATALAHILGFWYQPTCHTLLAGAFFESTCALGSQPVFWTRFGCSEFGWWMDECPKPRTKSLGARVLTVYAVLKLREASRLKRNPLATPFSFHYSDRDFALVRNRHACIHASPN